MDNNFNAPQGEYVMAQTPIKPKKKTGLIVGISVAVVALIAAIVAVVLIFVLGGSDIEGTWSYTENGTTVEVEFKGDDTGAMRFIMAGTTLFEMEFDYDFDEDTMVLTLEVDESAGEEMESSSCKVTKLTSDTMVWEQDGETIELKKVD